MVEFGQLIFLALTFPVKVEWLRDWEKSSDHQPFHFLSDKRYVELQYVWKQWMQASQLWTINHSVSATPVVCAKLDERDCYQTSVEVEVKQFLSRFVHLEEKFFSFWPKWILAASYRLPYYNKAAFSHSLNILIPRTGFRIILLLDQRNIWKHTLQSILQYRLYINWYLFLDSFDWKVFSALVKDCELQRNLVTHSVCSSKENIKIRKNIQRKKK